MLEKLKTKEGRQEVGRKIVKGVKRAGEVFWTLLPFVAAGTVVAYAVDAEVTSHKNEKMITAMMKNEMENIKIRNDNWDTIDRNFDNLSTEMDNLKKHHGELFQDALDVTEGVDKQTEEKEESAA